MSHTCAGTITYKKASPGTTVEVADENILPVDEFGAIEVDVDQPASTTKLFKRGSVAYVLHFSRSLLSTLDAEEQRKTAYLLQINSWLGVPGGEVTGFYLPLPQGVVFSNRRETDPEPGGGAKSK